MFYASSHLLLFFKWVSFQLKNRRELKHSSALIEVCNFWTHSGQINSSLCAQPGAFGGTHNRALAGIFAAMCDSFLSFLLHLALYFHHCPEWLARTLSVQWATSVISSSKELPWVVWEQTYIVQFLYPHQGVFFDCLIYF